MRSRFVPVALVSGALLLSGCGTGLQATTYTKESSPRDFDVTSAGDLQIRNLAIAAPTTGEVLKTGDTALLAGSVINNGDTDDALIGVESDAASSAALELADATVTSVPVKAGTDASTWTAQLTGLKSDLHSGQYISVTLVFAKAGRVEKLQVPVRSGDTGYTSRDEEQDPYHVGE